MSVTADTLVIHPGGALGDFVLCWPLVRTLVAEGKGVGIVSAHSRATLAASVLGVTALPDHLPPWSGLWAGGIQETPERDVRLLIAFGERSQGWVEAARRRFPQARVVLEARTLDRRVAIEFAASFAPVPRLHGPVVQSRAGPVVLHVGSGGFAKQWGLSSWFGLASELQRRGASVEIIAGEAEEERWTNGERKAFEEAGGRFLTTLTEFASLLAGARAFAGADCGPSHLAAQLGVPTLAVFGPTDPERWSPIGPRVSVVRAPKGTMNALGVEAVWEELNVLMNKEHA